jgi:hypothetical protein
VNHVLKPFIAQKPATISVTMSRVSDPLKAGDRVEFVSFAPKPDELSQLQPGDLGTVVDVGYGGARVAWDRGETLTMLTEDTIKPVETAGE